MALESHYPVQVEGLHGALSAEQSKVMLAKLKKDGDDTNIFDKHLALEEEIVGSPLVAGNKVELLIDGPVTYAAMLQAIKNAKNNINMESYIIEDDEVGNLFAQNLIEKQQSGVQINLIYDSFGSSSTPQSFFRKLKEHGINVLEYNPLNPLMSRKSWRFSERDHRKLLIVDGKQAFLGGINISSVYSSGSFSKPKPNAHQQPWRDTHLLISGPVVNEFQTLFIDTWIQQQGDAMMEKDYFPEQKLAGTEVIRAIGSSPDEDYSQIYATLLSAINSAESQIFLTNAYFVPDVRLLTALKDAVSRGVDTRLLLPDKTDSTLVYYASRSYYDELLSAGVKIYERKDALLHAKTAVIDGVWSTIGSTNLDWRSFVHNKEINAVILGKKFGNQMQAMYEKDLIASKAIKLEEWRKRSVLTRIKERAARIWATWL